MFRNRSAELGSSFVSGSPGSVSGASPGALSSHSGARWGLELTWGLLTDGTLPGVKLQACSLAVGKGPEVGGSRSQGHLQQTLEVLA